MKKSLLFAVLFASASLFAQDPVVQNASMDKIEKSEGSPCNCAGWINKDLGDQAESSSWSSDTHFGNKFDELESDLIYQEVAVLPNTDYTFKFYYNFEEKVKDPVENPSSLEFRILAGSGYIADYTPSYALPVDAPLSGFGYTDISEAENESNNLASITITPPGDKDFRTGTISFNSGDNTSIAIFGRGIGRDVAPVDGKDYLWSNGTHEIRIEYVTLTNDASSLSNESFDSNFNIYPSPAQNILKINSLNSINKIEISDLSGKIVISKTNLRNKSIDVSSLPKGVYVLSIENGNTVETTKFLKE